MDESHTSRKLRILIFSSRKDIEVLTTLKAFLLQKGCPVRVCYDLCELKDIANKPNADYGVAIILNEGSEKVSSQLHKARFSVLEYHPGRCSVTRLMEKIEAEAKTLGRF